MEIRRLTWDDHDAFAAIRREFFGEDEGVEWPIREFLAASGIAIGAFDDGALVGYAAGGLRSHAEGAWARQQPSSGSPISRNGTFERAIAGKESADAS